MLAHRRVSPSTTIAGTYIFFTQVERGTEGKCLSQCPQPGLEPGSLARGDERTSQKATASHVHKLRYKKKNANVICLPTKHKGVHKNSFKNVRAFQDRIGIWKCWFLRRGENRSTRRKTSRSREENQQQTQPTYDAGSGNRARDTLVGGERSHHCAIPAPLKDGELCHLQRDLN